MIPVDVGIQAHVRLYFTTRLYTSLYACVSRYVRIVMYGMWRYLIYVFREKEDIGKKKRRRTSAAGVCVEECLNEMFDFVSVI